MTRRPPPAAVDPGEAGPWLRDAAQAWGLALDDTQQGLLLRYLALLQRWNGVYNLSAIRDPAQMRTHHLLDCLAVVPAIDRHLASRALDPAAFRIADVGSGGGLPGVVLAVMRPQWSVTCIDAVAKKAAFVRQVGAELELPRLAARHARVEAVEQRFDLVVSRAFASLADFVRLTDALAGDHGAWMAMKGPGAASETDALDRSRHTFHVEQLSGPLPGERALVWIRRAA